MSQLAQAVLVITFLLVSPINWAAVGKVTEQTGPTEIVRKNKSMPSNVNTPVEMQDTITTAKAKAQLTFEDNTVVKINEQSKLVIDDFVYDPNKGSGKLAMKVALGTARYASGQIAKSNPQSVDIKTPTASIAVRGTDFSMTVDELGRSLIMLLPSCDNKGCVTGAIEVRNDAGVVFLDAPYQATMVATTSTPPSSPVVVKLDQNNINNLLIVSKPPELNNIEEVSGKDELANMLNVDFLKFSGLDKNFLDDFKELDMNQLDVDLLGNALVTFSVNLLDQQNNILLGNQLDKTLLPNYDPATGLKYYLNDDKSKVTLYRDTTHTAYVTVDTDKNAVVNIIQSGVQVTQQVNKGGSTVITINQK